MNEPNEKQRRQFEAFRRYIMPVLGVAEGIATQGKSPGTTALAVEQNYQNAEDRQRQFRRQNEADALQRKLTGAQLESAGREKSKYEAEEGRRADWESGVDRIQGLSEIERLTLRGAGPQEGIRYLIEKGKPDIAQSLVEMKLQGQKDLLTQRQRWEKDNPTVRKHSVSEQKNAEEAMKKQELQTKTLDLIQKVRNHPGKYSGISVGQATSFLPTEARDFKKQVAKLKSLLTLENLGYLKGPLSDRDRVFIEQASTALDLGGKEEAFDRELSSLENYVRGSSESDTGPGKTFNPNPPSPAPSGTSGFDETKRKRLEELRAKKAAGTLR